MRFWKIAKSCSLFCAIWISVFIILHSIWKLNVSHDQNGAFNKANLTEILWWNNLPDEYESIRFCGSNMCRFSTSRSKLLHAKAVLFYGSDLNIEDLPLPRQSNKLWALVHEESPRNKPFISHGIVLQHFNFTSTFSRYSDQPLTTQYLPSLTELISPTYMVTIGEKSMLRTRAHLAPVVFLQSDCDTMSGRELYVEELRRHIPIDSYGLCLHNRDLPKELTINYLNNLYSPTLLHFLARYKFIIAFENGVCYDYITEKFWRPLIIGSIPIYFGSPTIKDWAPNPKSVIYVSDYENPIALAEFLNKLDKNDTEYNSYLNHKYEQLQPVQNELLLLELQRRDYDGEFSGMEFFSNFECFMCSQVHALHPSQTQMATLNHYHCPLPPIYPPMKNIAVSYKNEWESIMQVGACTAKIVNFFLQRNVNFTKNEYESLLQKKITTDNCELKNN